MKMSTGLCESKVTKTVSLHPSELTDIKSSVLMKLNDMILQFEQSLNGIVLSYRKVKIYNNSLGFVDDAAVHYQVSFLVTYFKM